MPAAAGLIPTSLFRHLNLLDEGTICTHWFSLIGTEAVGDVDGMGSRLVDLVDTVDGPCPNPSSAGWLTLRPVRGQPAEKGPYTLDWGGCTQQTSVSQSVNGSHPERANHAPTVFPGEKLTDN